MAWEVDSTTPWVPVRNPRASPLRRPNLPKYRRSVRFSTGGWGGCVWVVCVCVRNQTLKTQPSHAGPIASMLKSHCHCIVRIWGHGGLYLSPAKYCPSGESSADPIGVKWGCSIGTGKRTPSDRQRIGKSGTIWTSSSSDSPLTCGRWGGMIAQFGCATEFPRPPIISGGRRGFSSRLRYIACRTSADARRHGAAGSPIADIHGAKNPSHLSAIYPM